eukprot:CAMPEP_0172372468 /NCGR_PEP_ID=MMETSP1060-20121228/47856_1 /TAXON_ID=37318 /ORGANISM="Pseudo-nitzschia pungens, Strain cf. cingulata" /LENGTH=68 /DNA_ID=CAMNT_0013098487 /DNA_START=8 /DNA_END=215 /DNA_ORIENTATION=-
MAASRGNAHPERLAEVLAGVLEEVAPLGNPNNTNANGKTMAMAIAIAITMAIPAGDGDGHGCFGMGKL